jgi:hypothetical protein
MVRGMRAGGDRGGGEFVEVLVDDFEIVIVDLSALSEPIHKPKSEFKL